MNLSLPNDDLLGLAWAQFWQVTVLIVAVGFARHLFCRRRPHLAYVLWLLVILKCLTPPLWSSPAGIFSWASGVHRAAEATSAGAVGRISNPSYPEPALSPAAILPDPAVGRISDPSYMEPGLSPTATLPDSVVGRSSNPSYPEHALSAGGVLLAMWASGAAVLAVLTLSGLLRCRHRVKHAAVSTPPSTESLVRELAAGVGLRRKVRLVITSSPIGPATFGWFRPLVVIPASVVAESGPDRLRPILAHELIHVRRGDVLFGLLQTLAQVVWWFHPLVWWANRRASRAVESCCDEEAIAALGCQPAAYVRSLVDVLQLRFRLPSLLAFPGIRSRGVTSIRLEHIMKHRGEFRRRIPRAYWLVLAAGAAVLVPGAGLVRESSPVPAAIAAEQPATQSPKQADVIEVTQVDEEISAEKGTRTLHFWVHVPKGERFYVTIQETPRRRGGYAGATFLDENDQDWPVYVTLALRLEGEKKPGDPLLSQSELLRVDYDAKGTRRGGVVSSTGVPLANVAPQERKIVLVKSENDWGAVAPRGRRVLLIYPKSKSAKTFEEIEPRAEIVVSKAPKEAARGKPDPAQQLTFLWFRQRTEIGSARIEFRPLSQGESGLLPLSPEQVEKILAEVPLDERPQDLDLAAPRLLQDKSVWARRTVHRFVSVGLRTREDQPVRADATDVRYYDGEIDLRYDSANRQAHVQSAGGSVVHRNTLDDFRISLGASPTVQKDSVKIRTDGQAVVTWRSRQVSDEIIADPATGFIRRQTVRSASGQVTREQFQFHPVTYPGKIVFPKIRIDLNYHSGQLGTARVFVLESAKFNEPLPAKAFVIDVPNAQGIFDHRKDDLRPKFHRVGGPILDLVTYIRDVIDGGE
jgi:beta-lactamase regulating signal transducer with metallopeptidase domain